MRNLNKYLNNHPEATAEDNLLKDGWSNSRQFSGLIGSPRARDVTADTIQKHV